MPKSLDKTKGAQKRKISANNSSNNTESDGNDGKPGPKKKKMQKKHVLEGIGMSKQLAAELAKKRTTRVRKNTKNSEPRLCGNGKPMPSLAELEAMYEDSDDEETSPATSTEPCKVERCETPEAKPLVTEEIPNSPTTLTQLASKVIDLLSKTIVIDDNDGPPPPVIPQKKPKKSDIPYIVGCKERKQVPWAPKTKFCVGSEKYGIDSDPGTDEDSDCPKKRKKRGTKANISKSIFNAQSDEIAERLKENEKLDHQRNGSPDSNDTVDYDFMNPSARYFSPLPSTSRDSETILKNDELFNKSLQAESFNDSLRVAINGSLKTEPNNMQDDIELIEIPCETVIIDDIPPEIQPQIASQHFDEDCCVIVEPEVKKDTSNMKPNSPIVDDVYGSIDLTQTFDDEVYEIADDEIDNLLAENQAILKKNARNDSTSNVIAVDPGVVIVQEEPSQDTLQNNNCVNEPIGISDNCNISQRSNSAGISTKPSPQSARQNEVADVVTKFFSQPQNSDATPSSSTNTVDLTSSQTTMISRLSNWISSSIESFLSNHQCTRTDGNCDIVIVEDNLPRVGHSTDNPNSRTINDNSAISNTQQTVFNVNTSPQTGNNKRQKNVSRANTMRSPIRDRPKTPPGRSLGDCPICMDNLANNAVASTLCGHIFCMGCIKASIQTNGKKCPTCRKKLKGVGYHQIFL